MSDTLDEILRNLNEMEELSDKASRAYYKGDEKELLNHFTEIRKRHKRLIGMFGIEYHRGERVEQKNNPATAKLISRLGHEIRSPLFYIDTYLKIFEDKEHYGSLYDEVDPDTGLKYRESALKKIGRSISQLRNRANYIFSPTQFEPHNLNDFIKDLHESSSLKPRGYDHVNISLDLDPEIGELDMDKGKMELVLQNLVRNACEAGAKNISIKTNRKGNDAYIDVTNDNSSIPGGKEEEIFERGKTFAWGKKKGVKGTGIGLDTVRDYVESHAGKIGTYSNKEKRETTFKIRIPHHVRERF